MLATALTTVALLPGLLTPTVAEVSQQTPLPILAPSTFVTDQTPLYGSGYGDRRESTHLAAHLASHGYLVAAQRFAGDSFADTLPGPDGEPPRMANTPIDESARRRPKQASELLPRVHKAISLLKRWMLGTHQGAISHEHLDYYLDEFVFRFNRRSSRSRGKLFYRLVQQAVMVEPTPYRSIVADWDAVPG